MGSTTAPTVLGWEQLSATCPPSEGRIHPNDLGTPETNACGWLNGGAMTHQDAEVGTTRVNSPRGDRRWCGSSTQVVGAGSAQGSRLSWFPPPGRAGPPAIPLTSRATAPPQASPSPVPPQAAWCPLGTCAVASTHLSGSSLSPWGLLPPRTGLCSPLCSHCYPAAEGLWDLHRTTSRSFTQRVKAKCLPCT